jgi:DNA-binding GntR family transcriptional regulator
MFAATLRDRIAQDLRDRILAGLLEDGSKLDLDEMAEAFGSSRTPVREALIQLSHDGLVEIIPRRGARVRGMALQDIRDNFDVFGALSGIAAEWATRRCGPELAEQLRRIDDALKPMSPAAELVEGNWAFHREINRACGSPRLIAMIGQLSRTMPAGYFNVIPEQADISVHEHRELLDAIGSGRSGEARRLAEEHVRKAGEQMIAHLERRAGSRKEPA